MNYEKAYIIKTPNKSEGNKFYIKDDSGEMISLQDFYKAHVKPLGIMGETTFRKRLKAGQSVADAVAMKPIIRVPKKPNEDETNRYLVKQLNKFGNTIVARRKVGTEEELAERLMNLGYHKFKIKYVFDKTALIEEVKKYYVIELTKENLC